jgi:hypothetical protein
MSIDPGVPYRIINAQSGLALHLLDTNNRSIIGNLVDNNDNRQVVRIACSFNSFCQCTHNILVDPIVHTSRFDFRISRNRTVHWISWRPEGWGEPRRWRPQYCQSLASRTSWGRTIRTEIQVQPSPSASVTTPKFDFL